MSQSSFDNYMKCKYPIENIGDYFLSRCKAFCSVRECAYKEELRENREQQRKDWDEWRSLPKEERHWLQEQLKSIAASQGERTRRLVVPGSHQAILITRRASRQRGSKDRIRKWRPVIYGPPRIARERLLCG